MERRKIIIVECLSTSANYIKDIIDEGYEPVLMELYSSERNSLAYRMPYDLSIKDMYLDENPGGEYPMIVQAPEDYEETLSIVRNMNPALIIPGSDAGIIWAARMSKDLNLISNSPETMEKARNKAKSQQIIREAGLRCIKGKTVSSIREAVEFYRELGKNKIVVKPNSGAASVGVYLCENEEQFMEAVTRSFENLSDESKNSGDILLQEYIEGQEYSVNTVSCKGHHKVTSVMYYEKELLPGGARIYKAWSNILPESRISESIIDYTLKVIDAVGWEYGPAHTEIMVDEDGPVLMEINGRLHGGLPRASWQKKILGESESTHSLRAYLHPDEFMKDERTVLMNGKMYGYERCLRIKEDIFVKKSLVPEAFADVPGFDYALGMGDNRLYARTIDLATASGLVFLAHENPDVISQSAKIIDNREKELEKLYITEKEV